MKSVIVSLLFIFTMKAQAQTNNTSVKHFWHTVETNSSQETIWDIWTDVDQWHTWDKGLQKAQMTEVFEQGSKGIITTLEGRKSKFKVVQYNEGKSYTFKTNLPLGSLSVKRYLERQDGVTSFTHEVWFSGLTGSIFAKRFGPEFMKMLPDVMLKIKEIAETR